MLSTSGPCCITRWWWIRHAPVINPGGRIYGQRDVVANCSDTESFARLAAILPQTALWRVTPLRRTRETAAAIVQQRPELLPEGVDTYPAEPAFLEQNFGVWQGQSHDAIFRLQPERAHRFWLTPAESCPPEGESFISVMQRVAAGIAESHRSCAGRDVVVVAHGGSIRAAVALALGLPGDTALRLRIDTLSLTRLDFFDGPGPATAWRVSGINLPPGSVLVP